MGKRRFKKKNENSIIEEGIEKKNIDMEEDVNINRWENSPYLEGLTGNVDESKTKLFESSPEQKIPDNIEEKPDVVFNDKSQILIGDNKGIYAQSNSPVIYGEFDTDLQNDDIDEIKEESVDVKSLSKKDYRYYLRTGRIP